MKRILVVVWALSVAASAASAATLSVWSDKTRYNIGETITLSIVGDAQGASAFGIYGRLLYNGARVDNGTRSQKTIGSGWVKGSLDATDTNTNGPTTASSEAFDQVNCCSGTQNATNPIATVVLIAVGLGDVNAIWDTLNPGFQLNFFGLTSAPGTSFTIVDEVPEPTSAGLIAIGLLALAWSHRRD